MKKILFVCSGNICRSPCAEGIMNALIQKHNLVDVLSCDSAGTHGYHTGELPDVRMRKHAVERGYDLNTHARQLDGANDVEAFDYLIAMDDGHLDVLRSFDHGKKNKHKIFKMTDFCKSHNLDHVPDPYYGGDKGFELVLDLLEDACTNFLEKIKSDLKS